MITIEQVAEIVVRHIPTNDEHSGITAEELAKEMREAMDNPAEDEDSIKAVVSIVQDIWQHGYDQGRATFGSTAG